MNNKESPEKNVPNIADYLYTRKAKDYPIEDFADILCRLIWAMDDNGQEIFLAQEAWLEGDDPEKVVLALEMNETYPYDTLQEMIVRFSLISARWPQFKKLCDEIIARRKAEPGEGT